MARLLYTAIASLDGYVADADGRFDWSVPDAEVHACVNERERPIGTYLYGRRLYDVMSAWDSVPTDRGDEHLRDYAALWQAADKVVFSRSLASVTTPRTQLLREFDPHVVRRLKDEAERDLSVGGPEIAGQALWAGLVDEIGLFLSPAIVGGGTRALPDGVRLDLALQEERRFGNGVVLLRYRVGA